MIHARLIPKTWHDARHHGAFVCGDTDTLKTAYAYPTSDYAEAARRNPSNATRLAAEIMANENMMRGYTADFPDTARFDHHNWILIYQHRPETAWLATARREQDLWVPTLFEPNMAAGHVLLAGRRKTRDAAIDFALAHMAECMPITPVLAMRETPFDLPDSAAKGAAQ